MTKSMSSLAFEQGRYREVVQTLNAKRKLQPIEIAALIGAHAFLGELIEARELWNLHSPSLPLEHAVRARFYLGIAATRVSKFKTGREFFKNNLVHAASAALTYQGIGFYLYFTGRFRLAKKQATLALRASIAEKNAYATFLATDLLGHCTVQLGNRSEGLGLLKRAVQLAKKHGNHNFAAAFDSASLIYEAEGGSADIREISLRLEKTFRSLEANDSYTRSNLILELARQWTLQGRWEDARALLNREASAIYSFGNRRQELVLQLRLAEIACCQGDKFSVEHFIQSARRCLNHIADRAFEIKVIGLEMKARTLFSPEAPLSTVLVERLKSLSQDYGSRVNQQILFRQGFAADPRTSQAEDELHHLFLRAAENPEAGAARALDLGMLGLWPRFSGLKPGASFFTLLEDGQSIVFGSASGISHREKALSHRDLRLLRALNQNLIGDKESLVKAVWGYEYDPSRHDSLLHAAIGKLRKTLDPQSQWLETHENGWMLSRNVKWQISEVSPVAEAAIVPSEFVKIAAATDALNFRQLRAKAHAPVDGFWSVKLYKDTFNVSTMTAFRDLDGLRAQGVLLKSGQGRATRYHFA